MERSTTLLLKTLVDRFFSGTTDLCSYSEEEMVTRVVAIYNHVKERGIKFIFSGIPPRKNKIHFNTKAKKFNTLVHKTLSKHDDVIICNNDKSTETSHCACKLFHTINLVEEIM